MKSVQIVGLALALVCAAGCSPTTATWTPVTPTPSSSPGSAGPSPAPGVAGAAGQARQAVVPSAAPRRLRTSTGPAEPDPVITDAPADSDDGSLDGVGPGDPGLDPSDGTDDPGNPSDPWDPGGDDDPGAPPVESVTPGAPCGDDGALGQTDLGVWMECVATPDDPELRWHHA